MSEALKGYEDRAFMVRDMEKMQQICIDALTREESPVEGGGEAASPQTVG